MTIARSNRRGLGVGSEIYGPTDGLLAYWPLNGNTNDYSGNGQHAIRVGGGISFVDGIDGGVQAAQTDGTLNGFIDYPDIEMNGLDSFAVSFWMKDINNTPFCRFVSKDQQGIQGAFLIYRYQGLVYFSVHNGSDFVVNSMNIPEGVETIWGAHHVVCQLEPTSPRLELYLDGSLITYEGFIGTLDDSDNEIITLFADSDPGIKERQLPSPGKIQGVRLYNRELTAAEIATLYAEFTP